MVEVKLTARDVVHDLLGILTFAYNKLSEEDQKIIKAEVDRIMFQGGFDVLHNSN